MMLILNCLFDNPQSALYLSLVLMLCILKQRFFLPFSTSYNFVLKVG